MNIKEIGSCLYLCEGTKAHIKLNGTIAKRIEICNSNPKVIKYFLFYLRTFNIDEKKLRARIALHKDKNEIEAKKYWSEITGISISQFLQTSWRDSSGWCKNRLPYGTIIIRYGSAKIFNEIMKDIEYYFPL